MKTKMIKTILPTLFGVLTVLGLLVIFNLIKNEGDAFFLPDNGFLNWFVPSLTILALLIQFTMIIPLWNKFSKHRNVWGLTLIQLTGIQCILFGLLFGLVFGETRLGLIELFMISLTGTIAFVVYWSVNFLTLYKLDKIYRQTEQKYFT
ncbi:MAG: hypothetical protein WCP69_09500 [Bacteroidota bacterium]